MANGKDFADAIRQQVKKRRLKLGLSQQKLALRVGMSQQGVWFIESGRNDPQLQSLYRLAQGLETTVSALARSAEKDMGT